MLQQLWHVLHLLRKHRLPNFFFSFIQKISSLVNRIQWVLFLNSLMLCEQRWERCKMREEEWRNLQIKYNHWHINVHRLMQHRLVLISLYKWRYQRQYVDYLYHQQSKNLIQMYHALMWFLHIANCRRHLPKKKKMKQKKKERTVRGKSWKFIWKTTERKKIVSY